MIKRLNVIVIAHEFSPSQGSECAVGWNLILNLCKHHNVKVIYAETNQFKTANYENSINHYISEKGIIDGLELFPLSQPKITNIYVKINSIFKSPNSAIGFAPLYYAGYKVWQKAAFKVAEEIIKKKHIDIVHQLTSISFREPGYLWKLDIPFVWGPVSGLVKVPRSFYTNLSFKEIVFETFRLFSNFSQAKISQRIKNATKQAAIIYTVTNCDYDYFKPRAKNEVKMMLDVGSYSNQNVNEFINKTCGKRLKLLWVGRMVYTKALYILLKALSINEKFNNKIELTIVGDGPLRYKYENISKELGLKNLTWIGNISHNQVFEIMQNSDIFIHTSIKEATSAVILEALTFGLAVICHDAFGMSLAINETCGIKIPLKSPVESINGFYKAIDECLQDRERLEILKLGAKRRSQELTWESMADIIAFDYREIDRKIND